MKRERSKHRALCLWLPNWPLQRLRLARPELKHRELVLYEKRRGCLCVVAADQYCAGTPLVQVTRGCAVEHDPHADHAALLQLAAWCERFSPIVGVEPPDNLVLDIGGSSPLFGGEDLLVRHVLRAFQRRDLDLRLAVADTLGAAWALAHYGRSPAIAPPGTMAIADLPVAALRIDAQTHLLTELGIERIGQLLALRRDALASRFAPELLRRLDQATGILPEPIASHRPPPEIVVETRLEYPAENRREVDAILWQLIERVTRMLIERQQGALQLECELVCEGEAVTFRIGLFRASASAKHLLELAQMQLDRAMLPGPVGSLKLSVLLTAPFQSRQQELFELLCGEERREVALLVDRLSSRLGREAVVRAVHEAEAQPELAIRYEPLTGALPRKTPTLIQSLPRPLRLETEPKPLEVLSVVPDGPPIQFYFSGLHQVAHANGPERIQTGWWRGRYTQRDYYRVETTAGKRFWLFRRLGDGKWFLHGVFD